MSKLNYRPDIDGLRAIAILSVVLYHFFPSFLPGGFTGVDIFFVISGYFITKIILKELSQGNFTFWGFYKRRILRIFPALITVFVVFLIFGWGVLFQDEFQNLGKHIFGGSFFISNFILWRESGYFDSAADLKPFLNLWSLAIEEQFYLGWPIFLVLCMKLKRPKFIFWGTLTILFISLFLGIYLSPLKSVFSFYLPFTRVWELLIGALIPIFNLEDKMTLIRKNHPSIDTTGGVLGFFLILFSLTFINEKTFYYPYFWALFPTIGSALIILFRKSWFNKTILSKRILVFIGLISYPLYLWHWPLLSFSKIIGGGIDPTLWHKIILIFLSFGFSVITYFFIERPIRFNFKNKNIKVKIILFIVFFTGAFNNLLVKRGVLKVYNKDNINNLIKGYDGEILNIFQYNGFDFYFLKSLNKNQTVFYGDSNALHYYSRIKFAINKNPRLNSAVFITKGACAPIDGVFRKSDPECEKMKKDFFKYLEEHNEVKTVVFSAAWSQHLLPGFKYFFKNDFGEISPLKHSYEKALLKLEKTIIKLKRSGKEVFLVLNIPVSGLLSPLRLKERNNFWLKKPLNSKEKNKKIKPMGISIDFWKKKSAPFNDKLRFFAERAGAKIIDPSDFLCSRGGCEITRAGIPLYRDSCESYGHLNLISAEKYATYIDQTLDL